MSVEVPCSDVKPDSLSLYGQVRRGRYSLPQLYGEAEEVTFGDRPIYCQPFTCGQQAMHDLKPGYGPLPGQTAYSTGLQGTVVMTAQSRVGPSALIVTHQQQPQSYISLSIFVMLCCNVLFGLIAVVFSIQSDNAAHIYDHSGARTKGKIALFFNTVGIVSSLIAVTVVVSYVISRGNVTNTNRW
ncbi:uncharacterized protein LOC106157341 [Lingula anatina]|uniref:Uncharacterized protein LOC106157341 n=1 Tax=Lingula anatina TaxID=7574 RepID=A0A1S3HSA5_LINAN|nr:uncharacterized protein LOC106157341 [Lingula anatina]|eukprot:XP_013388426.1 uncharacterized protein LOC106157341 [Lingula anatina]